MYPLISGTPFFKRAGEMDVIWAKVMGYCWWPVSGLDGVCTINDICCGIDTWGREYRVVVLGLLLSVPNQHTQFNQ